MNAWATGFGQKVTISGKDLPLEKVFTIIKKQTGYVFFYDYSIFQGTKNVTVNFRNLEIEEAMIVCLQGQNLDFSITNKTISVVRKNEILQDPGPTIEIKGVILNEGGQPLEGASVTIKQSNRSTLTNAKGEFTLNHVPVGGMLVISYVGYVNKFLVAKDNGPVSIHLTPAVNQLDQAVVQAYGTTSQRLTTGNIVKVTSEEIQRQPVMNPLLALQGKVTGLDVTMTNGYASAPVKVELRGRSSINQFFHSDPLYIIDGVPLTFVGLNDGSYVGGSPGYIQNGLSGPAGGQSPLFNINPSDIESIEVLKDADATAIYGSRGANGVILITTKKGKPGKSQFSLRALEGVTHVTRYFSMLNTPQYLAMRKQAVLNDVKNIDPVADYDINETWDTTRYTNWEKALFGGTGRTTNVEAGLSGGNAQTTFRLSAGYNRTTNIMTTNGADQRSSASLSLTHKSADQRFSATLSTGYTITKSDLAELPGTVTLAPNAPAIYDSAGNLNFAGWGGSKNNSNARGAFPFGVLKQQYVAKTNFINSNLLLSYQIFKGLVVSSTFGYNNALLSQSRLTPISSKDPASSPTGSADWGNNTNANWIIEPQLNYNTVLSKGKLSVLLGSSIQRTQTDALRINGSGYGSDDLLGTLSAAPTLTTYQYSGQYRYAAVFGRITYNWENKYLVNLNARRDGSSRFGEGKQYGSFGSVGAAWIFTEENWFKRFAHILSFGKLRASYGTTGSDAIGDYQYFTQYSSVGTYPYGGDQSLIPTVQGNPNFQWQVNKKLEAALNLGFLGDRINIQIAYYRDRCGNQLIDYPLPLFSGFPTVAANSSALVENTGMEYTASFKIMQLKKFSWSVDFNMAVNRNKLVSYPDFNLSPYAGTLVIGKPLNIQRLLHYTGVDPLTGAYTFYDKDHNGQITYDYTGLTPDDTYSVDLSPKFFGGVGFNFNYQSLHLSLFFNYKKQTGLNAMKSLRYPGTINANQPVDVLDHWRTPGDVARFSAFTTKRFVQNNNYFSSQSDGVYTDASFIRLSNVSLSYNFPSSLLGKAKIQSCSVFLNANNLLLITNYKGIDPETQNFSGLPPTRTIVGGLSFNF